MRSARAYVASHLLPIADVWWNVLDSRSSVYHRFAANVTINMALAHTSVSSVTILSSLSGLFTLVLGSIFSVEKFNMTKLLAVIARWVSDISFLVQTSDRLTDVSRSPVSSRTLLCSNVCSHLLYSILGVILVSKADNEVVPTADPSLLLLDDPSSSPKVPQHPILGDILAIASAACYAIYTLLLKVSEAASGCACESGTRC